MAHFFRKRNSPQKINISLKSKCTKKVVPFLKIYIINNLPSWIMNADSGMSNCRIYCTTFILNTDCQSGVWDVLLITTQHFSHNIHEDQVFISSSIDRKIYYCNNQASIVGCQFLYLHNSNRLSHWNLCTIKYVWYNLKNVSYKYQIHAVKKKNNVSWIINSHNL